MKFKVLAVALCLVLSGVVCVAGYAADMLSQGEDIIRAMRYADDARSAFERTPKASGDYAKMEREWHEREYQLEETRLRTMARETRRSEDELRALRRDGKSWEDISRHYNHKSDSLGLGKRKYNQFDRHDGPGRDYYKHPGKAKGHYKGTADGPPGHYDKKEHPGKAKGHHKGTADGPPGHYKDNDKGKGKRDKRKDKEDRHR